MKYRSGISVVDYVQTVVADEIGEGGRAWGIRRMGMESDVILAACETHVCGVRCTR